MRIKKFNEFIKEAISGTELVGPVGPAYGETRLQNKTISQTNTSLVGVKNVKNTSSKNSLTDDLFFEDDYIKLHNDYLKAGGSESDLTGSNEENMSIILNYLNQ